MNVDINDIVTNLVPFPRLNYLLSSMAPLFGARDVKQSTIGYLMSKQVEMRCLQMHSCPKHSC